jgi:ABC-type methionine transport system ATPase subunit
MLSKKLKLTIRQVQVTNHSTGKRAVSRLKEINFSWFEISQHQIYGVGGRSQNLKCTLVPEVTS